MHNLYDRETMARALTLDLDPRLHRLLANRIASLRTEYGDLTDQTTYLIVEEGDTEPDIVRAVGFSPMVDPIDGRRWPHPAFAPGWSYLADCEGWFEMIVTFGSTFACILLIADRDGVSDELRQMCRYHVDHAD